MGRQLVFRLRRGVDGGDRGAVILAGQPGREVEGEHRAREEVIAAGGESEAAACEEFRTAGKPAGVVEALEHILCARADAAGEGAGESVEGGRGMRRQELQQVPRVGKPGDPFFQGLEIPGEAGR